MILPVVLLPDPLLKTPCQSVHHDQVGLASFLDAMVETLYHHPRCVGLAANQVGKPWQVLVVDAARTHKPGSHHGLVVLLNPSIVHQEGQKLLREGCLSVPDYTGNVVRSTKLVVEGLDRHGKSQRLQAEGFEAVVFQHELDHLAGKLFLDRVASVTTDVYRRQNYA